MYKWITLPTPAISFFKSENCSVVSNSLQPHGLYSPWNSPGQNTGVGSLSLLQGIFPTQGSNTGLLHCRWIFYQQSHKGSPLRVTHYKSTTLKKKSPITQRISILFSLILFYLKICVSGEGGNSLCSLGFCVSDKKLTSWGGKNTRHIISVHNFKLILRYRKLPNQNYHY